jgi:hypothetical protein
MKSILAILKLTPQDPFGMVFESQDLFAASGQKPCQSAH